MKRYLSSLISHLSSRKGFTLIELLVTISIIGILSSFLLANFIGVRQRSRDGVRKSDLRQIQSALELYRADKGVYPAGLQPCSSRFDDGADPPVIYMQKIPCDPSTSTRYQYFSPSGGTVYCLRACLENTNDSDRDELKNPSITGCTLSDCSNVKSNYTLQSP